MEDKISQINSAIYWDDLIALRKLLKTKEEADTAVLNSDTGYNALHYAIYSKRTAMVLFLLKELKVDVHWRDAEGQPPLFTAANNYYIFKNYLSQRGEFLEENTCRNIAWLLLSHGAGAEPDDEAYRWVAYMGWPLHRLVRVLREVGLEESTVSYEAKLWVGWRADWLRRNDPAKSRLTKPRRKIEFLNT